MMIIGCDYHPSWQQTCWLDTATGETGELKLEHASGEAEKFYRGLSGHVLIGMESRRGKYSRSSNKIAARSGNLAGRLHQFCAFHQHLGASRIISIPATALGEARHRS
jgi:hypothetical protein